MTGPSSWCSWIQSDRPHHRRVDKATPTYGSRKTASLRSSCSTPCNSPQVTPVGPIRHFCMLSANHLTMYTRIPPTAVSCRKDSRAATRCLSASDEAVGSAEAGKVGTRDEVRREKYSCSSWGSCALADGRTAAFPVVGAGVRVASVRHVVPLLHSCRGGRDSRPALELGAGFSGMAGCTPSTASQCAFHLTPAELANPAGRGSLRYVAKSISSSGT